MWPRVQGLWPGAMVMGYRSGQGWWEWEGGEEEQRRKERSLAGGGQIEPAGAVQLGWGDQQEEEGGRRQ